MCKVINNDQNIRQLIEIHNRPYLVNKIYSKIKGTNLITLFLHNDPLEMKGSFSINDRKKLLLRLDKIFCVSNFIKKRFLEENDEKHARNSKTLLHILLLLTALWATFAKCRC